MRTPPDAHDHHRAEALLEDFVLGTLSAEDEAWMQAHLQSCPECQAEIGPLLEAAQALPFAAPEPDVAMSDDVWNRIERSISDPGRTWPSTSPVPEPPTPLTISEPSPARLTARHWLAIAALMLISLVGGVLLGQVIPLIDDDAQAQVIAIEFTEPGVTATGELRYLPDEQVFVLTVDNMPEAPEGHVYQAWLIEGDAPVSAGVMNIDNGEVASVGDRSQFDTFAITVEPGPLGNEAPTSDPIIVAPLHADATS